VGARRIARDSADSKKTELSSGRLQIKVYRSRVMRFLLTAALMLGCVSLHAAQHTGSVRAADQFIPGATVTARNGGAKLVAYTDEFGRYSLELTPGVWEIQIEMFGFAPFRKEIQMGPLDDHRDWTIEVPRSARGGDVATAAPVVNTGRGRGGRGFGQGQGGRRGGGFGAAGGRGGTQAGGRVGTTQAGGRASLPAAATTANAQPAGRGGPQPGFQNVQVTATEAGEQALATSANQAPPEVETSAFDTESYVVQGSQSGGLSAAADEQDRRERLAGRGGPGGPGAGGLGMASASTEVAFNGAGIDPLGMGAFGAAGANNGFGVDNGGGFGPPGGRAGAGGAGGGRGGPALGGRGGGGGGGGGRGAGFGAGGRGGRGNPAAGRGPFNGQFAQIGNRRRTQPAYTGSFAVTANNSALNATPFSLNGQAIDKPYSAHETVAFNVGGPLRIPKLLTYERSQLTISYSGNRSRNGTHQAAALPTAEERRGDFSNAVTNVPITIYDPLTHLPFPRNMIPQTRFNPAAAGLLQYFPQPLFSGIVQNYQLDSSLPSGSNSLGVRFNAPINRKDRLNFNEQLNWNNSQNQQLFGFQDASEGSGLSAGAGWSHSFKPRFNSSLNIAFSRSRSTQAPYFAYRSNVAAELGITGTSQDPISWGPPNLSFTNFSGLSDSSASVSRNQTVNVTEALTYVYKRHNLTAGVGYRRLQQNSLSYANSRGAFSFSGLLTSGFDAGNQPLPGTGMDFADFLLGLPQTSNLRLGNSNNYFRSWSMNWYAQDDWRIKPTLSINLGLRYEYFAPYTELHGHLANLDLSPQWNGVSVVTPGESGVYSGGFPSSLINSDRNNYSPRLAFSWRPSRRSSRIFRGGYSIFFSGAAYGQFAARMAAQPPFATTASLSTSTEDPLTLQNGFPMVPSQTVTNTYGIDRGWKPAYAQTWTVALQQTFPHGILAELEYLGTKGTGLDITLQPNRAAPGSPLTAQQRLAIGNATGFTWETSQGNSIFHAGQIRLTRRFQRGMSANALYTFSKSIDNASSFGGGGGVVAQNPQNLALERGLSSFDQRHHLQLNYTLSSPVGIHGLFRNGGWKTKAFTGWTLNGGFNVTSGIPLTARVSGNLSNTGGTAAFGSGRAEATGADIESGAYPYFNLLAFTLPPGGQYGNAGRDTIPGLFQVSLNSSLNRAFRLSDSSRRQIQLRVSANNALNHVTITNIGTTVNSATYGLPTTAAQMRTVQVNLRFSF
jgi:hypothetical protein